MATELKKKQNYLIEKNWWLLHLFASKHPLKTLFFVAPFGVYFLFQSADLGFIITLKCFFIGVLWWTFLEYMIHRFFFHWLSYFKNLIYYIGSFHLYHHRIPSDRRVYTSGLTPAIFWSVVSLNIFPLVFKTEEVYLISFFTLCSYFVYEFAHYYAHVKEFKSGYLKFIQQNHLHHHLNPNVNFGQTSPLWDILLGTYAPANETKNELRKDFLYVEGTWKS